jgi:hypothetical protein
VKIAVVKSSHHITLSASPDMILPADCSKGSKKPIHIGHVVVRHAFFITLVKSQDRRDTRETKQGSSAQL